jgi:hypothetical protein
MWMLGCPSTPSREIQLSPTLRGDFPDNKFIFLLMGGPHYSLELSFSTSTFPTFPPFQTLSYMFFYLYFSLFFVNFCWLNLPLCFWCRLIQGLISDCTYFSPPLTYPFGQLLDINKIILILKVKTLVLHMKTLKHHFSSEKKIK